MRFVSSKEYKKTLDQIRAAFMVALDLSGDDLDRAVDDKIQKLQIAVDPAEAEAHLRAQDRDRVITAHWLARSFHQDDPNPKTVKRFADEGIEYTYVSKGWAPAGVARQVVDLARAVANEDRARVPVALMAAVDLVLSREIHDVSDVDSLAEDVRRVIL